jgi:spore coat polysaccharide biosynthesis protein SpsF (cytidylyltransferase family)
MDYMKIQSLAVLQARMSSRRLPGKVLMLVNDIPMIHWQIKRVLKSTSINEPLYVKNGLYIFLEIYILESP